MAQIPTPKTSVDRKLHRIVLNSDSNYFKTAISLARTIADQNLEEFSYQRNNKILFATPVSISKFISYAREIGLLNENLDSTQPKADVRSTENFQWWVKSQVMIYLEKNNSSLEDIKKATLTLMGDLPYFLPSVDKIHDGLKTSISKTSFRTSLKIISALNPMALKFSSRKLVIHPDVFKG